MPFALILVGAILIITSIRDTHRQLGQLLVNDFTGSGSFLVWLGALVAIGMLGYIPHMRTPSRLLLGLVVIGVFVANKDKSVFTQLSNALKEGAPASGTQAQDVPPPLPAAIPVQIQGGTGGSGGAAGEAGQALGIAKTALSIFGF